MSSVSIPRSSSTARCSSAEVVADRADHPDLGEEAGGEREVDGRAAEHPLALAERRADGVERDRADDGEGHGGGILTDSATMRAIRIEDFGGPEVMEAGRASRPRARRRRGRRRRRPLRGQLRRHPRDPRTTTSPSRPCRWSRAARSAAHAPTAGGWPRSSPAAATRRRSRSPRRWLVPVPDAVGDDQAAALLLQGLTAHALLHRCARVEPGETVVVEAAAGGTGTLAVQLAKRAGARVIGLASSADKRELAERLGADATVDSRAERARRRRSSRRTAASRSTWSSQMTGGETFEACAQDPGPVRAHGRLRDRLARAQRGLDRAPDAQLACGDRLLARCTCMPAPRPGRAG